jgi:hypothetical protein
MTDPFTPADPDPVSAIEAILVPAVIFIGAANSIL